MLILELFREYFFPSANLMYLYRGLMKRLGLSSSFNDTPVSKLLPSNDTIAVNTRNVLDCFCSVFVILKLRQHYIANMHFHCLHFGSVISSMKL